MRAHASASPCASGRTLSADARMHDASLWRRQLDRRRQVVLRFSGGATCERNPITVWSVCVRWRMRTSREAAIARAGHLPFGRRDDQGEAGARGVMVPRGRGGRASTNLESVNGPNGAIARQ